MSEFDDIDGDDPGDAPLAEAGPDPSPLDHGTVCLACGGTSTGPYCPWCGQRNDDLRRSSFVLAKDFFKDTFGFDSRMWRTLGLLAVKPGDVPKDYAHGKRSRFTPPVRLFLVVSFLFFLTIGLTNTLFLGLEVTFHDQDANSGGAKAAVIVDDPASGAPASGAKASELDCGFHATLRYFVKERALATDKEHMDACISRLSEQARDEVSSSKQVIIGEDEGRETEIEQATEIMDRIFGGIRWAVTNPRAFNDSFNDWLPRVLFFMTPVLALILTVFIRRGVLVFDHLVLAFYAHAAGFAIIGLSLILAQFGAPHMGLIAFAALGAYYLAALKSAYGRGWIKTVWTALMSGAIYISVLFIVVMTIVSNIVWRAAA